MVPLPGPSSSSLVTPQVTRIDSSNGTAEEFVRVDTSTSHFEGEPYDELAARTTAALQEYESYGPNSSVNDCAVPTRATHNYRSLMTGTIPRSLVSEGRPFGFLQLQHFVFNVMAPEHLESLGHYKPFVDGALGYLDGMREFDDWESRLSDAAYQYPGGAPGVSNGDVFGWDSNPFVDSGFPTNACFAGAESIWWPVDLEEWIYLFWARRLADGNLEVTEDMLRRISEMMQ